VRTLAVLLLPFLAGCAFTRLETDHPANFKQIFGDAPEGLKVVNSVVFSSGCFLVPDDWEFELYTPPSWVNAQKTSMRLTAQKPAWETGARFPGRFWRPEWASPWFAAGEPAAYEVWDSALTTTPYRHLYLDKATVGRDSIHVFYRKDRR